MPWIVWIVVVLLVLWAIGVADSYFVRRYRAADPPAVQEEDEPGV